MPQAYYRPSNVFDGDPRTSWRVSPAFVNEDEQWIRVDLREPTDVTDVDLVAAQTQPTELSPDPMHVTRATVVLSDGTERSVELVDGQGRAHFDAHPTDSVEVRIEGVGGTDPRPFGFSEITVDELDLRETIQLPDDLIRKAQDSPAAARAARAGPPLTYQFARLEQLDDHAVEPSLHRRFRTIGERPYTVRGRFASDSTADPATCRDIGLTIDGTSVLVRGDADRAFPLLRLRSGGARWRVAHAPHRTGARHPPALARDRRDASRRRLLPAVPVAPMSWTSGRPTSRSTRPSTRPA